MVIKGKARGGAGSLAAHLLRTDHNERVHLHELRGVVAEDLEGALREMAASVAEARTRRPFYHAAINSRADETLTDMQKARAIDRLEHELGLTGQPRAVQAHRKEGRDHLHVVWLRVDRETMTAIPDSYNFRRHEIVARELEREFGHERVQGAHIEREGVQRPQRTPSTAEMMQAERSGIAPEEAKDRLRALWERAQDGQTFKAVLEAEGWTLARGDKRGFVALDPAGEVRSVNKDITGLSAAKVRERLADLDLDHLPNVDQVREQRREQVRTQAQTRQQDHVPEPRQKATQEPEKRPDPAEERAAWAARLRALAQPDREPERMPEPPRQAPDMERVGRLREVLEAARSRLSALGQRLDAAYQRVRERALRPEPEPQPHRKTVAEAMEEWRKAQEPERTPPRPQPERRRSVAEEMLERARLRRETERAAETPLMREAREQKERERELSRSRSREQERGRGMSRRHCQPVPGAWGLEKGKKVLISKHIKLS